MPASNRSNTLIISNSNTITTVIERFDVASNKQKDAIDKIKAVADAWAKDDKFVGYGLLRSRGKTGGIAIYSQWKHQDNAAVLQKPDNAHSMKAALTDYKLVDSDNFSVAFTSQDPDLGPPV